MVRSLLVGLFLVALSIPAHADSILLNGSFEFGPPDFGIHDIDILPGSTEITGWTVVGGGVDLLEDPWDVQDGIRAIDLDLRSPGGIEQTFATVIGQSYLVSFWVASVVHSVVHAAAEHHRIVAINVRHIADRARHHRCRACEPRPRWGWRCPVPTRTGLRSRPALALFSRPRSCPSEVKCHRPESARCGHLRK